MAFKDKEQRIDYANNYNEKIRSKRFFNPGEIVEVCGSQENRTSRIGMKCKIIRRGFGSQYWVKFENEPEMIFRAAWLRRENEYRETES